MGSVCSCGDTKPLPQRPPQQKAPQPQHKKGAPPHPPAGEQAAGPRCLRNVFYETAAECRAQRYCASVSEITAEWLSNALNAPVASFSVKICEQGQVGLTVLISIVYGGATGGAASAARPSSVAMKMHAQGEEQRAVNSSMRMYDRELYVYANMGSSLPIRMPKLIGLWTDAHGADLPEGPAVEFFNLMMEDLSTGWDVYNPVTGPIPTSDELATIVLAAQPLHVKFWKDTSICKPPFSATGRRFDLSSFRPLAMMMHQTWPAFRDALPKLAGWNHATAHGWPEEHNDVIALNDRLTADDTRLGMQVFDAAMKVIQSRPMTLVHGDFNCGNVWKSKAAGGGLLFADYQLTMMGPIGFDFMTMLLLVPKDRVEDGKILALMSTYHAALPASIREEYPLSQLYDDLRVLLTPMCMAGSAMFASMMDPSKMPADKFDWTWKHMLPNCVDLARVLYVEMDGIKIVDQLLDGTYNNYGKEVVSAP